MGFADTRAKGDPSSGFSWIAPNVFRVGWLENSGQGTVAANRKSAKAVTDGIIAAVRNGRLPLGAPGFAAIAEQLHQRVDFDGWRRIDAYELTTCAADRLRCKVTERSRMLDIAFDAGGQVAAKIA